MFTSYRIDFCSVSQHYSVSCEQTFATTLILNMSLKNLSIILIRFGGKLFGKKTRENTAILTRTKCRKNQQIVAGQMIQ